jgi:hypothetical protein
MGIAKELEILWEDLIAAFDNADPEIIYFLDRDSGEVFFVPTDYDDESFWDDIETKTEQYLEIPSLTYEEERVLVHDFISNLPKGPLKEVMTFSFTGKNSFGKIEEILSFYPDEMETFNILKEEMLSSRIKSWLEEHDIYPPIEQF